MAITPLIDVSRASELIPNFNDADNSVLTDIVAAASDTVCKYCARDFTLQTYDEVYDGTGDYNLLLNQYPITQVLRVAYTYQQAVMIRNQDNLVTRASWRLDGDTSSPPLPNNLTLISANAGIVTTIVIGPLTSTTPTVTVNGGSPTTIGQMLTYADLSNAINTYGGANGWTSQPLGQFPTWPLADVRPPQGAFEARWFGTTYLMLHAWGLQSFDYRPTTGEIVSPQGFSWGYQNYRVIYQAGFETIPDAIQQATAALAVSVYNGRSVNTNLAGENLGSYSYTTIAEKTFHNLDLISRYSLNLYKDRRVAKFKLTY
jgi:hypothetical protein